LPGGVGDPGFEELLGLIDESVFRPARRVDVYFEGEKAFDAMIRDVDAASTEVLLESYIFKGDETGRRFQRVLIAAAGRGVRVRVLADALGSFSTRSVFWSELRRAGIETRLYHPLGVPLRFLKFRDHRKILVVDRRVAYTGGMNIGNEYGSSLLPSEGVFRDTHARVEGQTAWEAAIVFREGWLRAGGSAMPLEPLVPADASGPRVMVLDSRPGRGAQETASVYAAIVGAARRRLWITVAYFAPRPRVLPILGGAARRGVDVRLLLPGRSDVRLARHSGHGFYANLLSLGVRLFEYQPSILHAKTFVADGSAAVIGSSNLDFRSFERNAECNFVILDETVGATMERQFEKDLAESVEILLPGWRRRGWLHRMGDAGARRLAPLL
jgi:cardiolipin synthase